jgi:hypothetical protein
MTFEKAAQVPRNDTCDSAPRRDAPEILLKNLRPLKTEGAGNAGCPMHPQKPRARWGSEVCARVFAAEAPETAGIPHAMVLRFPPRSPGTGSIAPVTCATRWRRRKLSASVEVPGPHGFAVRKQAALVSRAARVHRIPPHVRDDRDTPLETRGDGESKPHISKKQKLNIFRAASGRAFSIESAREIRFYAHAICRAGERATAVDCGRSCSSGESVDAKDGAR